MMKKKSIIKRIVDPFFEFTHEESFSGILLIILTVSALLWSNSQYAPAYFHIWHMEFTVGLEEHLFTRNLHFWINDGLMAVFFLVVGLEIKRELIDGELSSFKLAAFPITAAIGGMLFPAVIFALFNFDTEYIKGWAIPTATDIAFSIGILSLLGKRISTKLKIFLVALAIVDDMGAVIVIAIFYSSSMSVGWLFIGLFIFLIQLYFNRRNNDNILLYIFMCILLWIALYNSGIHPTIAGILTASAIPAQKKKTNGIEISLLQKLEKDLHPWVTYLIIPLFAFSNAGVQLKGNILDSLTSTLTIGIILGLFIGKPLGITLISYITTKAGLTSLPTGTKFSQIFGVGLVAGIGFTMSLFIANLAFSESLGNDLSKIGILTGSLISGIAGFIFLRFRKPAG